MYYYRVNHSLTLHNWLIYSGDSTSFKEKYLPVRTVQQLWCRYCCDIALELLLLYYHPFVRVSVPWWSNETVDRFSYWSDVYRVSTDDEGKLNNFCIFMFINCCLYIKFCLIILCIYVCLWIGASNKLWQ